MKPEHWALCAIAAAAIILFVICNHVKESDIAACQKNTGWDTNKCMIELSR